MTALLTTALKRLCGALNNLVSPAGVNWDCHREKGAFFPQAIADKEGIHFHLSP